MKQASQTTLNDTLSLTGIGVHSNAPVTIDLHPAPADTGIVFRRTDIKGQRNTSIAANWGNVSMTELCTVIGDPAKVSVATIEHLMASFAGLELDNVLIDINGPEVPIMDGSSASFVEAIDAIGLRTLSAPRRYLRILKSVRIESGRGFSELRPATGGFRLEVEIDFKEAIIGRQSKMLQLTPQTFRREISRARTFGFLRDVEHLWKAGFALGSSLDNTVALDDERVLNPEGLRFADEFVRHKTLDAIGDLSLAGAPILGAYRSYCGGHKMNSAVLDALFADPSAYEFVEAPRQTVGGGRTDIRVAASPAFAADRS
jgi:UDP-3-O-[3-hydroxymyristoyl] N-acetylglucosamine deacetylase